MQAFFYTFLDHFTASYTGRILTEALQLLGQLWLYVVLGILASTLLKVFVNRQRMAGFFSRRGHDLSILVAALIGMVSPLGSYVIIPMSAALLVTGVPLSVLMALMVASPLMNPNLFVLTAGALGPEMAVLRALSAFLLGTLAGYLCLWIEKKQLYNPARLIRDRRTFPLADPFPGGPAPGFGVFFHELYKMTLYIGKYFVLAILVAAAIKIAVNPKFIVRLFDSDNFLSVALSTAAGVPFYVCGGASIPVVQQLADLGMSKGAVLAFFISGPVSKVSNLVIIQASFRGIVLILYLTIGITGALVFGLVYNLV